MPYYDDNCVCPKDFAGIVTQHLIHCPYPGHGMTPPATYPPPPDPCKCHYDENGYLIRSTQCYVNHDG